MLKNLRASDTGRVVQNFSQLATAVAVSLVLTNIYSATAIAAAYTTRVDGLTANPVQTPLVANADSAAVKTLESKTVEPADITVIGSNKALASKLSVGHTAVSPDVAHASTTSLMSRLSLGHSDVPVRQWSNNSIKTRGIIVAVHGAARHSGTFQPLAEQLASQGFLVVSPDLRGHGDWYFSAKNKQEKIADYEASTDDVVHLIKYLKIEHPSLPIFCLGESAGAAVAIKAAIQYPTLSGLVLSSIGTRPCIHGIPTIAHDVITGITHFDQPLDVKDTMAKYASDDMRVSEGAANDPMLKPGLSARELIRTAVLLNHTGSFAAKLPDHIPVLVLQGKMDRIVEPASALRVLRKVASKDKELVEFPCGHILLSTPFLRDDVISALSGWLTAKSAGQQTASLGLGSVKN